MAFMKTARSSSLLRRRSESQLMTKPNGPLVSTISQPAVVSWNRRRETLFSGPSRRDHHFSQTKVLFDGTANVLKAGFWRKQ